MIIVAHVTHSYDWAPLDEGIPVTEDDKLHKRVLPSANGGWRARLEIPGDTHVSMKISEAIIIGKIIQKYTENLRCGVILTRHQAVASILAENLLITRAHPKRVTHFDENSHDDGPHKDLFLATIAPHLEANHGHAIGMKNIDPEDVDALVAAYMMDEPQEEHPDSDPDRPVKQMRSPIGQDHVKRRGKALLDHLHNHFRIKPKPKPTTTTVQEGAK